MDVLLCVAYCIHRTAGRTLVWAKLNRHSVQCSALALFFFLNCGKREGGGELVTEKSRPAELLAGLLPPLIHGEEVRPIHLECDGEYCFSKPIPPLAALGRRHNAAVMDPMIFFCSLFPRTCTLCSRRRPPDRGWRRRRRRRQPQQSMQMMCALLHGLL